MGAALDAALAYDINFVTHRVANLGKLIKRRARAIQLTPAMVGDHDPGAANIDSALRILDRHDAFQREFTIPLCAKLLCIFPRHGWVEHAREILANRNGDIGSLIDMSR